MSNKDIPKYEPKARQTASGPVPTTESSPVGEDMTTEFGGMKLHVDDGEKTPTQGTTKGMSCPRPRVSSLLGCVQQASSLGRGCALRIHSPWPHLGCTRVLTSELIGFLSCLSYSYTLLYLPSPSGPLLLIASC